MDTTSTTLLVVFASLLCITAVGVASPVAMGTEDASVVAAAKNGAGGELEVEMKSADVSRIVEEPLQEEQDLGRMTESSRQVQLGTEKVREYYRESRPL